MREKIANFFPTPEIVTNTTIDIRSTVHERAHFRKSFAKNHFISLTTLVYNDKKYYNCIQFNKTLIRYKLQKRDKQDRYENVMSFSVNFSVSFIEEAFKNTLPKKNQK